MQRDQLRAFCMTLAMSATNYGNHRSWENRSQLVKAIESILVTLPVRDINSHLSSEHIMSIVRHALICGRAHGLSWSEMRSIFNDVNEKAPPTALEALKKLSNSIQGRVAQ
ncbi:MAG: hypothetical protein JKX94_05830 [Sneathiella sp.]|nr:hypothetical protein [Sneathiella sp.]